MSCLVDNTNNVSVIIPAYNCEEYLTRCVTSVIKANPLEVIIVNDASTDETAKVCAMLEKKDERIRIVQNKENKGVVFTRQEGINESKGEFIAFVDSDDWIEGNFLTYANRLLLQNEEIDIIVGKAIFSNDSGLRTYLCRYKEEIVIDHNQAINELFLWNYYRWELWGKVFRRKLFKGWKADENIRVCEDLDCTWWLFSKSKNILCLPQDYYHYFFNENSVSYNNDILQSNSYRVFEKIIASSKGVLSQKALDIVYRNYFNCLVNMLREAVWMEKDSSFIDSIQCKLEKLCNDTKMQLSDKVIETINNPKKAIDTLSNELVLLLNRIPKRFIYIYGTGIVSDFITRILIRNGFHDFSYVVSDGQIRRNRYKGRNVGYVSEINKNSCILLALNEKTQTQVENVLKKLGYSHIYRIDTKGIV